MFPLQASVIEPADDKRKSYVNLEESLSSPAASNMSHNSGKRSEKSKKISKRARKALQTKRKMELLEVHKDLLKKVKLMNGEEKMKKHPIITPREIIPSDIKIEIDQQQRDIERRNNDYNKRLRKQQAKEQKAEKKKRQAEKRKLSRSKVQDKAQNHNSSPLRPPNKLRHFQETECPTMMSSKTMAELVKETSYDTMKLNKEIVEINTWKSKTQGWISKPNLSHTVILGTPSVNSGSLNGGENVTFRFKSFGKLPPLKLLLPKRKLSKPSLSSFGMPPPPGFENHNKSAEIVHFAGSCKERQIAEAHCTKELAKTNTSTKDQFPSVTLPSTHAVSGKPMTSLCRLTTCMSYGHSSKQIVPSNHRVSSSTVSEHCNSASIKQETDGKEDVVAPLPSSEIMSDKCSNDDTSNHTVPRSTVSEHCNSTSIKQETDGKENVVAPLPSSEIMSDKCSNEDTSNHTVPSSTVSEHCNSTSIKQETYGRKDKLEKNAHTKFSLTQDHVLDHYDDDLSSIEFPAEKLTRPGVCHNSVQFYIKENQTSDHLYFGESTSKTNVHYPATMSLYPCKVNRSSEFDNKGSQLKMPDLQALDKDTGKVNIKSSNEVESQTFSVKSTEEKTVCAPNVDTVLKCIWSNTSESASQPRQPISTTGNTTVMSKPNSSIKHIRPAVDSLKAKHTLDSDKFNDLSTKNNLSTENDMIKPLTSILHMLTLGGQEAAEQQDKEKKRFLENLSTNVTQPQEFAAQKIDSSSPVSFPVDLPNCQILPTLFQKKNFEKGIEPGMVNGGYQKENAKNYFKSNMEIGGMNACPEQVEQNVGINLRVNNDFQNNKDQQHTDSQYSLKMNSSVVKTQHLLGSYRYSPALQVHKPQSVSLASTRISKERQLFGLNSPSLTQSAFHHPSVSTVKNQLRNAAPSLHSLGQVLPDGASSGINASSVPFSNSTLPIAELLALSIKEQEDQLFQLSCDLQAKLTMLASLTQGSNVAANQSAQNMNLLVNAPKLHGMTDPDSFNFSGNQYLSDGQLQAILKKIPPISLEEENWSECVNTPALKSAQHMNLLGNRQEQPNAPRLQGMTDSDSFSDSRNVSGNQYLNDEQLQAILKKIPPIPLEEENWSEGVNTPALKSAQNMNLLGNRQEQPNTSRLQCLTDSDNFNDSRDVSGNQYLSDGQLQAILKKIPSIPLEEENWSEGINTFAPKSLYGSSLSLELVHSNRSAASQAIGGYEAGLRFGRILDMSATKKMPLLKVKIDNTQQKLKEQPLRCLDIVSHKIQQTSCAPLRKPVTVSQCQFSIKNRKPLIRKPDDPYIAKEALISLRNRHRHC